MKASDPAQVIAVNAEVAKYRQEVATIRDEIASKTVPSTLGLQDHDHEVELAEPG